LLRPLMRFCYGVESLRAIHMRRVAAAFMIAAVVAMVSSRASTVAARPKEQLLEQLARARFAALTTAEERLLQAAADGEQADCEASQGKQTDCVNTRNWPKQWKIRAALIRWLCVDADARRFVDRHGLRIRRAWIPDSLDLSFADVPFPLSLRFCFLDAPFNLTHTRIPAVDLDGSQVGRIQADGLISEGDLSLKGPFHTCGGVSLLEQTSSATSTEGTDYLRIEAETPSSPNVSKSGADSI